MAELDRREVYRNFQIRPALGILHCPIEDPFAERGKKARVFGDGNELRGRHLAMHRMAPTQQRLHADDGARAA